MFDFPLDRHPDWAPGPAHQALLRLKSLMPYRGLDRDATNVELIPLSGSCAPLAAADFPLLFLTHNDLRFLPSFLAHYRGMGVTRFICVDDISTDATREHLARQPDVDLYGSNVRYRDAERGKIWREMLLDKYGQGRWYLNIDSDEYFLYETLGEEPIGDYTKRLDAARIRRVPAPMLDLYPVGGLETALFGDKPDEMPWAVATHFDGDGYTARASDNGLSVTGGVRARMFGAAGELMKYPLLRWDRQCSLGRTVHRPRPALYNFPPVMAALLHFKVFSDFADRTRYAVEAQQHHKGAELYRLLLDRLDATEELDLAYPASLRYTDVRDLIERGFMRPLEPKRN